MGRLVALYRHRSNVFPACSWVSTARPPETGHFDRLMTSSEGPGSPLDDRFCRPSFPAWTARRRKRSCPSSYLVTMPHREEVPCPERARGDYDRRMTQGDFKDIRGGELQGRAYSSPQHGPARRSCCSTASGCRTATSAGCTRAGHGGNHLCVGFTRLRRDAASRAEALSVSEYARFTGRMLDALGMSPAWRSAIPWALNSPMDLALQRPSLVSHLVLIGAGGGLQAANRPAAGSRPRSRQHAGAAID